MSYKKMKTFNQKVKGVNVYSSRTEFRRYSIEVLNHLGEFSYVYQNKKPTIKELKELFKKIRNNPKY